MLRPGPTPDTMVAQVSHDGSKYLVTVNATREPISVAIRVERNRAFYSWRKVWAAGEPPTRVWDAIMAQLKETA